MNNKPLIEKLRFVPISLGVIYFMLVLTFDVSLALNYSMLLIIFLITTFFVIKLWHTIKKESFYIFIISILLTGIVFIYQLMAYWPADAYCFQSFSYAALQQIDRPFNIKNLGSFPSHLCSGLTFESRVGTTSNYWRLIVYKSSSSTTMVPTYQINLYPYGTPTFSIRHYHWTLPYSVCGTDSV